MSESREEDVVVLHRPPPCTLKELARLAEGPLRRAGAIRALAFGSWARGTADAWSDLDLVVVLDTDLPKTERGNQLKEMVEALPVGVDLLVFTPEEWEEGNRRRMGVFDALAREGVALYERSRR